jgi:hypothetical protein
MIFKTKPKVYAYSIGVIKATQEYFFDQTGQKINAELANSILEYCRLCASFILSKQIVKK